MRERKVVQVIETQLGGSIIAWPMLKVWLDEQKFRPLQKVRVTVETIIEPGRRQERER